MKQYVEFLVQYHGNLNELLYGRDIAIDIITKTYAIIRAPVSQIDYLQSLLQIEYIEASEIIDELIIPGELKYSLYEEKKKRGFSGQGVIVGWIGKQMPIQYNNYRDINGKTRIVCMHDGKREYDQESITHLQKMQKTYGHTDAASVLDIVAGNNGIAFKSNIIIVNFQRKQLYSGDIIRAVRFIINQSCSYERPVIIYIPFDIKKGRSEYKTLAQKILNDMMSYYKVSIVCPTNANNSIDLYSSNSIRAKQLADENTQEIRKQKGILNYVESVIFASDASQTVGALALLMEWGEVNKNLPGLYGNKLKTYYIRKVLPMLKKDMDTIGYRERIELNLMELLLPRQMGSQFRTINLAYRFAKEDDIIQAFIMYDNTDIQKAMQHLPNIKIYPLTFPYYGVQGTVAEIRVLIDEVLGSNTAGTLSYVLGSEPIIIQETTLKPNVMTVSKTQFTGKNTLIGIIDTGIDYTNAAFIDSKGETRIMGIWDQTVGSSSTYGFGTMYDREQINEALKSSDPFSIVPHQDEQGEGTMVAAIAAGNMATNQGQYKGAAPEAELAIVKLRPASKAVQEIFYGDHTPLAYAAVDVALAAQYLAGLAINRKQPIVICIPVGTNEGSHDGTDILDTVLNSYARIQGITIICSAGDEGDKNHHAEERLQEGTIQNITLTVPKDQKGFVVEVWAAFGDYLEVSLTPPAKNNMPPPTVLLNEPQNYKVDGESYIWTQGTQFDAETGCQVILLRLDNPIPGDWIISIKGVVIVDGRFDIWIPRTGQIKPNTKLIPSSPFTTIQNSSAAVGLITPGCYDLNAQAVYSSSGRGNARDDRTKPDFVVAGIKVPAPLPKNKFGVITGTASSSAITAGVCALIYDSKMKGGNAILPNTPIMKGIIVRNLTRDSVSTYPNRSGGYGLLDISSLAWIRE